MKTKLALFDIDQTILYSGGAGEKALGDAVEDLFGDGDLAGIEIAGRTDFGIARQVLECRGLEPTESETKRFLAAYLGHLERKLGEIKGHLLPGFPEILERLGAMPSVALGLLTGNVKRGAELKLRHYGVWQYFSFGAFADDSHDRNQLGAFALARANAACGTEFLPGNTFVLGDTPHDIACAKAFKARSVGVASGNFTRAQLAACDPDFVFDNLGDPPAVIETLGLEGK